MNSTIKVSIPESFYTDVLNLRCLHYMGGSETIWGRMFIEQYKAEADRKLGAKKNFFMMLTADDLNDIITLCEQDLKNDWEADMLAPYRYMLKQAQKKLDALNS